MKNEEILKLQSLVFQAVIKNKRFGAQKLRVEELFALELCSSNPARVTLDSLEASLRKENDRAGSYLNSLQKPNTNDGNDDHDLICLIIKRRVEESEDRRARAKVREHNAMIREAISARTAADMTSKSVEELEASSMSDAK